MTSSALGRPRIVHETPGRIRFHWQRLLAPSLDPRYLEAWIGHIPGVDKVRVNPRGRALVVEHDGKKRTRRALLTALKRVPAEAFDRKLVAERRPRIADAAFMGGLAAAVPFMPVVLAGATAWGMGLPVVLSGLDTLATRGLKVRVLDMVTVGASLLRRDYATAAAIAAMVEFGEFLRQVTEDRSNSLLQRLVADPVERVWVEREGCEKGIPFDSARPGDLVLCGSGETVPVDGVVADGEALLDMRSLTGESAPVSVEPGSEVFSGSVVSEGRLKITAVNTGAETGMARIAAFMTRALGEKSQAELKSDELADRLTPLTLGLGAALYGLTRDMERALSVLTVDFACAVKFPAPVVVKTSMYAAARRGVLVKSGSALDALARVDAVVFDKTGTLTTGHLAVSEAVPGPGMDPDELLRLAASVEDRYGHPVGRAVVREAESRGLPPHPASDTDFSVAHGVAGTVLGRRILVGNRHFIHDDSGVDCSDLNDEADALRARGRGVVYVARDGTLAGILALKDEVRPEAETVVRRLRESGVKEIVVLTGDHRDTAEAFFRDFPHVDRVRSELNPREKADLVQELREGGRTVAVVGDGVNDAPAFVAADVGVCMSQSTGLARDSAQIVLTRDSLDGLVAVRHAALRADRILERCFDTGVTVNVGLLLAASAGLLRPALAAAIHNANTFAILGGAAWGASRELPGS